ncbi:hypothetical protein C8258_30390 [Nocardia sp. MDA0666]|nr:hypothetical protein C8258_30390 [Nocardia sp. MDA0666]
MVCEFIGFGHRSTGSCLLLGECPQLFQRWQFAFYSIRLDHSREAVLRMVPAVLQDLQWRELLLVPLAQSQLPETGCDLRCLACGVKGKVVGSVIVDRGPEIADVPTFFDYRKIADSAGCAGRVAA